MGLETGTFISDLNAANPTSGDPKSQGDDHLRLIKSTVKATFPNVTGAVTPTHTELNYVDGVTSPIQTQLDGKATTAQGAKADTAVQSVNGKSGTSVTLVKADVGLGNVDNTSDLSKPVSTATQSALDLKANLASPAFTGTPTAPTAASGTNSTQIATTAFVVSQAFSSALPGQTGNAGKYLYTNGTAASWEAAQGVITVTGLLVGNGLGSISSAVAGSDYITPTGTETLTNKTLTDPSLNNSNLTAIKNAVFNGQNTISSTSGNITVDWTVAQNQLQTEPTGTITYTFTAPPGPCHLQLIINSDGTSTAQTINWPGTVIQYGLTWAGVNNKRAVINFWYDGTNYHMIGTNQV